MGDLKVNTGYFKTNRGIIKILEIIVGIIVCKSFFAAVTVGFVSELNFAVLIINVIFLILNFTSYNMENAERIYSIVCTVAFLIAIILNFWAVFANNVPIGSLLSSAVLMAVMFALFLWDVKIQQGEAKN